MRMMRNITIAALSFLITFAIGLMARAQSTSTLTLALTQKSFEVSTADDTARVDLLKEIKKINAAAVTSGQLEIQMLRVKAKTGVGGAQFFLRINNEFVDSQSLETDPDQLTTADLTSAGRVELKNIERDSIKEASLIIQSYSNSKVISVDVVLGPVTEVAILGHYADEQVQLVSGASATEESQDVVLKPTADALANIQSKYYAAGALGTAVPNPAAPASSTSSATGTSPIANQLAATLTNAAAAARNGGVATQVTQVSATTATSSNSSATVVVSNSSEHRNTVQVAQTQQQPQEKPRLCVVNRRGNKICVGDKVRNRWGISGIVQDMQNQNGQNMVLVKFGFGDTKWREVDSVSN